MNTLRSFSHDVMLVVGRKKTFLTIGKLNSVFMQSFGLSQMSNENSQTLRLNYTETFYFSSFV